MHVKKTICWNTIIAYYLLPPDSLFPKDTQHKDLAINVLYTILYILTTHNFFLSYFSGASSRTLLVITGERNLVLCTNSNSFATLTKINKKIQLVPKQAVLTSAIWYLQLEHKIIITLRNLPLLLILARLLKIWQVPIFWVVKQLLLWSLQNLLEEVVATIPWKLLHHRKSKNSKTRKVKLNS